MDELTLHEIVKSISKIGYISLNSVEVGTDLPKRLISLGLCETGTFRYSGVTIHKLTPTDKWSDLMTNWLKANYKELKSEGK